jgi:hypothetical protein
MDSTPVLVEEEVTVRVPRISMAALVFSGAQHETLDDGTCSHCGEAHIPDDDTYYPGAL